MLSVEDRFLKCLVDLPRFLVLLTRSVHFQVPRSSAGCFQFLWKRGGKLILGDADRF